MLIEDQVNSFFKEIDNFLHVQFDHAQGFLVYDEVVATQSRLISFITNLQFNKKEFDDAKMGWVNILNGLSVNLGFPELQNLSSTGINTKEILEESRKKIKDLSFLSILKKFIDNDFSMNGIGLSIAPEEWLRESDVKFDNEINPEFFKNILFQISDFESTNAKYEFKRSLSNGFFMMSLNISSQFFIGHGPLNSLFNLSAFAHELGHSTTLKKSSLEKYFLEFPKEQSNKSLVNNEDDSYLYEKIFAENVDALLGRMELESSDEFSMLLLKRKAIQNNLHILKNHMNYLYFSGTSLDEILKVFTNRIRIIFPEYSIKTNLDWLNYATLDKPLSLVGYIKAYQKNFL